MNRFRVLQVVETLRPGGAENVVATLAVQLRRDRFEVEVAALVEAGEVAERIVAAGVPLHVIGKRRGFDLGALVRLRRLLASGRYDLIHTHNPIANHWTVLACRLLPGAPPVVLTEHSIHYRGRIAWWYPAARAVIGLGNRAIVGVCEAVTESHRRIDPLNRAKYVTIHNGIDPIAPLDDRAREALRREIGLAAGHRVVGTVGNLRPAKAHADLLAAIPAVFREFPEVRLVVAGAGPMEADLARLAKGLGIAERVHWLGRRSDVPRLLSVFDVFALSSAREGFPVAVLEAASAGVAMVATDVGGVGEVIHDGVTGRLVPPGRPDVLGQAIGSLLRDTDAARRMADAARDLYHSRFTAEAMTRKVEDLYAEILGLPRPLPTLGAARLT